MNKLIVILGPTASGKSDLAVRIALLIKKNKLGGFSGAEIVSADSRQVYKGMDIGSGKIPQKEMQGVPHHLLDVAPPKRRFTVAQYQKLAWKAIKKIWKHNKLPIICGGTGFYIHSIVNGLIIPKVPPDAKLRAQLEKLSTEELFKKLKKLDLRRAKNIDRHNRRRLIRALEIVIKTGKPVPEWKYNRHPEFISGSFQNISDDQYNTLIIGLGLPKKEVSKRIKKRLLKRLKQGMVKEVRNLHEQGISWKRLEEFGLEYRAVALYLQKKISRQEMIEKIQKESKQYVKRQLTWFKRDKRIKWIKNYKEAKRLVKNFLNQGTKN